MTQTVDSPALTASQSSWRCSQAHDREGWLALMADDVVIEDPIGKSVTNPDGTGVRGKEAVGAFFDSNIAPIGLTITVRGVFTYKVNDAGLITNMRGYWNLDAMKFGKEE